MMRREVKGKRRVSENAKEHDMRKMDVPMRPYKASENRDAVKRDAVDIMAYLMASPLPIMRTQTGNNLIRTIIQEPVWKHGTCDGENNVMYATPEAIANTSTDNSAIKRDHVFTMAKTTAMLLDHWGDTDYAIKVLEERSVTCFVTRAQFSQLKKFDDIFDGFERYRAAGITIIDRSTGFQLKFPVSEEERQKRRQKLEDACKEEKEARERREKAEQELWELEADDLPF